MRFNRKETEVMVSPKYPVNINIKMDDSALKQASKFQYTVSIFTEEGRNK